MAKILLADDLSFIKMVEKEALEKGGHIVIGEAEDGVDAVEKYKQLKPDVVLMDITMPRMDGLGAIKAILKIDPNARIIVCSALGQQKLIVDAIKNGAKDFVVKPFDNKRLLLSVQKVLK